MKHNRRSFLKKTGMTLSAISLSATTVQGTSSSNEIISAKQYDRMKKEYGKGEAKVIRRILEKYTQKFRNGILNQEQAYKKATQKLISNQKTDTIAKSINEVKEIKQEHREAERRGSADLSQDIEPITTSGASTSFRPSDGEKGGNSSFVTGAADRSYDVGLEEMGVFARISGYGDATSWARLYDSIYISGNIAGNVRISVPYLRVGNTRNATCKISLFIRESYNSNTMVVEPVEWPGWTDGSVRKNAQFYLSGGTTYDIGLELRGMVHGIDAYKFCDYGTAQSDLESRRVELNGDITVESLD